ncbi:MAG: aminoglycoside phosphotransferase family protein [Oscillospiraceae bacterium]|nr:aminoglycoside phosphotransferase family protein [Oscillospiraceae bacterium]
MYSNTNRDEAYKHRLLDFIRREYGITVTDIAPAKRGFYGETWKINTKNTRCFLKLVYAVEHKEVYKHSLPITQHLCDHGIDFISRIVKTKHGGLFAEFDGAILGVFVWIDGENAQNEDTKPVEYQLLAKVYTVPTDGLCIPREDFSSSEVDLFFRRWRALGREEVLALLEKNRDKIEHRAKRLKAAAKLCQGDTSGFVITHGDAGGNFLQSCDRNYIVDWDGVLLAPPERDAWVCCQWDWARDAFCNALQQNGIDYTLRIERLAFYAYWYFFFYLNAFLDSRVEVGIIEEYIDGWIEGSFRYIDEQKL